MKHKLLIFIAIFFIGVPFTYIWQKYLILNIFVYEDDEIKGHLRIPNYLNKNDILKLISWREETIHIPKKFRNIKNLYLVKHSIKEVEEEKLEYLPYPTVKRYTSSLVYPQKRIVKRGKRGIKSTVYKVYFLNGEEWYRKEIASFVKEETEPQVIFIGKRLISKRLIKGATQRSLSPIPSPDIIEKSFILEATAYSDTYRCCGKWKGKLTSFGLEKKYGVVAVDPNIIPLGTKLYVEGYGYAIAGDTGSAIKGYRIDLFYPTEKEAILFGRKKIKVHIVKKNYNNI